MKLPNPQPQQHHGLPKPNRPTPISHTKTAIQSQTTTIEPNGPYDIAITPHINNIEPAFTIARKLNRSSTTNRPSFQPRRKRCDHYTPNQSFQEAKKVYNFLPFVDLSGNSLFFVIFRFEIEEKKCVGEKNKKSNKI